MKKENKDPPFRLWTLSGCTLSLFARLYVCACDRELYDTQLFSKRTPLLLFCFSIPFISFYYNFTSFTYFSIATHPFLIIFQIPFFILSVRDRSEMKISNKIRRLFFIFHFSDWHWDGTESRYDNWTLHTFQLLEILGSYHRLRPNYENKTIFFTNWRINCGQFLYSNVFSLDVHKVY